MGLYKDLLIYTGKKRGNGNENDVTEDLCKATEQACKASIRKAKSNLQKNDNYQGMLETKARNMKEKYEPMTRYNGEARRTNRFNVFA